MADSKKISLNGKPLVEEARLTPTVMRMSEQDGLRMLRKFPSLWRVLEVKHAQTDNPEYWFDFDVMLPANEGNGGYDDD
jgi:hypothetical protein